MAYESYYTNKIIKTTKAQYDALKNGESIKGYKFNEKDTFVLDIDSLYNDLANKTETDNGINKSLYNLGYYDTITENSDGTYTITRQTGYVDIDNETLTYFSDNNRPRWLICNLSDKAVIPSVNTELGQIITGNYETKTEANAWNTNSGMSLNTSGEVVIYGATRPTGIIQYKLATPYTEKVEKNHYAAYNQNFILEHNKSEAERSANLFNPNNVEYGSINEDGSNLGSWTARARSFYIHVLSNTYYSIRTNNSELLVYELYQYDSNKSHIEPYTPISKDTFTFLTRNNTYYIRILFRTPTNTDFNLDILSSVMLNYGTTPLPYQQYEGKVVHEKDLDKYAAKTITIPDNTNLDTVTESGFYRLNMNPNFPHAQMIVSRGADTIAQMAFPYADTTMYVRTGNPFNTSGGLWHDWKQVAFTDNIPTATTSKIGGVKSTKTGTTPNRDYKVQVNDDGTMKVNVPWTDTKLDLNDINYDTNNTINVGTLDINNGITFNTSGTIQELMNCISPASDVIRRSINLVFTSVKQSGNTLGKVNSLMMTANISKTSNSDSAEYLLVGYFKITVSSNDRRIYKLYIGLSNSINGYQCDAFKCELYGTF